MSTFLWEYEGGWKIVGIDYCTWHIGMYIHRSPCPLPVASRPCSNSTIHLATVRYRRESFPTASTNSQWHSLVFLPRRTAILIYARTYARCSSRVSKSSLHTVFRVSLVFRQHARNPAKTNLFQQPLFQYFAYTRFSYSHLEWHFFHCYMSIGQNQFVNALILARTLCIVRSAAARKISNIGTPIFTT